MRFQDSFARTVVAASAMLVLSMVLRTAQADAIIYKYTGRDGVTVYSQTLPESYSPADVQTVRIESLPEEQQRAVVRMLDAKDNQSHADAAGHSARFDIADRNIAAAIRDLRQAESDLKNGSELVGGDRVTNTQVQRPLCRELSMFKTITVDIRRIHAGFTST